MDEDSKFPEIPRDVREGDAFGVIERLKRERASFSCFGMSCVVTIAVLLAIAAIVCAIRVLLH